MKDLLILIARLLTTIAKLLGPGGAWSVDLFRCESILLKSHWVLIVMDQFTRRNICVFCVQWHGLQLASDQIAQNGVHLRYYGALTLANQ